MFSDSGSSPTIPGKVDLLTSSRKSCSPAFWVTQTLECGMAVPGGTAIPHFNVWVTREVGLPLVPELVRRLPGSVGYDPESKNMLKNQADAQVEMTMEEVIAVIAAEDAREQRTPTKVDLLTTSRKSSSPAFWVTQTLECGMAVPGGTAVPHFNVWVTREAGLPLFPELVRRLPGSVGDDPESKNMLKNQADAQVEMTMEQVIAVIAAEDAREQRTPTKVDLLTSSRKSGSPAFWVTQSLECGMAVPGGTAIPHFNVWVTREVGLPLFPELVRRLPGSVGYDPESKNMLKNQADAQVEMTMEKVIAVIAAEDA
eukprot:jgi/Undpi1/13182/HiC_scaffold_8.g02844.m1